jgi:flagella basal body P-ring formation protein FlgA
MHRIILALSIALAWLGVARAEQVAAPTIVTGDTIAAKIAETLAARIPVAGRYHVAFADPAFALTLPAAAQGRFDIATLTFDATRQAFAASVTFAGAAGQLQIANVTGTAYPAIDVPALAHDLAPGEVIADQDLVTIELPAERASATLVTGADMLTGQAARRPLRARQPIFNYDVKKPVVVKKGELVTIVFALPGLELTAAGEALSDGGKGDVIPVLNARSRRTIEGRVSGAGTVSVQSSTTALAVAQQ